MVWQGKLLLWIIKSLYKLFLIYGLQPIVVTSKNVSRAGIFDVRERVISCTCTCGFQRHVHISLRSAPGFRVVWIGSRNAVCVICNTHTHTHTHTHAHRSAIHSTVTYLVFRGKRMGPVGDLNDAMDNGRGLFQRNDAWWNWKIACWPEECACESVMQLCLGPSLIHTSSAEEVCLVVLACLCREVPLYWIWKCVMLMLVTNFSSHKASKRDWEAQN